MVLLLHFIGSVLEPLCLMQALLSQTGQDGACSCVTICVTLSNVCRALNVTNAFKAAATREGKMVIEGARMGPGRVIRRACLPSHVS